MNSLDMIVFLVRVAVWIGALLLIDRAYRRYITAQVRKEVRREVTRRVREYDESDVS